MKTIQNALHFSFSDNVIRKGDNVINVLFYIIVFSLLITPFALLIERLS